MNNTERALVALADYKSHAIKFHTAKALKYKNALAIRTNTPEYHGKDNLYRKHKQ